MVQKRTCDYTGEDIEPGTGTMFVRNDGTILWFKDSKAKKNYMMGREARDLDWIGYEEAEGVEAESPAEEVEDTGAAAEEADADEAEDTDADEADADADEEADADDEAVKADDDVDEEDDAAEEETEAEA